MLDGNIGTFYINVNINRSIVIFTSMLVCAHNTPHTPNYELALAQARRRRFFARSEVEALTALTSLYLIGTSLQKKL